MGHTYQDLASHEATLLGLQLGRQQILTAKDAQLSGMVFCPQRLAHIAVMRCGEYQQRLGCASLSQWSRVNGQSFAPPHLLTTGKCPGAAKKKLLKEIREAAQKKGGADLIDDGSDPFECNKCGHALGNGQTCYAGRLCWRCAGKPRKPRSDKGKPRGKYGPTIKPKKSFLSL